MWSALQYLKGEYRYSYIIKIGITNRCGYGASTRDEQVGEFGDDEIEMRLHTWSFIGESNGVVQVKSMPPLIDLLID